MREGGVAARIAGVGLVLAAAAGAVICGRGGDRTVAIAWLGGAGPTLVLAMTGPGILLVLLAAASAIVPGGRPWRRTLAVLATGAVAFAGDPVLLLAAWIATGFAEEREDAAPLPARLGDAAMATAVVLVLAGRPGSAAAVALGLAVLARVGALPFGPLAPRSVLTTALAGVAAVLVLGASTGAPEVLAGVLGGGALLTAAAAAAGREPERAAVLAASSRIALAAAAVAAGAAGPGLDLVVAVLPGLGLILLAHRAPLSPDGRAAAALLGAATLAGIPPLAGFGPGVRLLEALRSSGPVALGLAVATLPFVAAASFRVVRRLPGGEARRSGPARAAAVLLVGVSVVAGLLVLPETAGPELVAALAAAAAALPGWAYADRGGADPIDVLAAAAGRIRERGRTARRRLAGLREAPVRLAARLVDGLRARTGPPGPAPVLVAFAVLVALALVLAHLAPHLREIVGCSPR